MSDFYGLPTRSIASGDLEIACLESAGPRIVGLRYKGSPNLLAEVPEICLDTPYGPYRYLGGHRLWHAPEAMPRSYIPDEDGLTITALPNGLLLDGKTEPGSGMRKRIEVRLDPDRPVVTLKHTLVNAGLWDVELAPWAITMFRLGGTVILPTQALHSDPEALLPDRRISLWAYSQVHDPRLRIEDEVILLEAKPGLPPFKIGTFNPQGWMAYWLDGILFRKSFEVFPDLPYPDNGCNAESYCDGHFVELESLGPLARLAPGQAITHSETWQVYESLDQDFLPRNRL